MTSYSSGRSRICCRKASAIASLMTMLRPVFGFFSWHQGPPSIGCAPNSALRQRVAPVAEAAFGELHDVALVHDRHRLAVVVDRVLQRLAHQPLGAFARHRLDADAGGGRKADLLDPQLPDQKVDDLLRPLGFGLPFDAGIDVLRILPEDHHVGLLRGLQRTGHPGEVAHRTQADVQVELLAQRHVERPDAPAHRRGQRALDRHHILLHQRQRLLRQPHVRTVDPGRLLAGVDLHPVNPALAAVGLGHRRVHDLDHHRRNIQAGAIALDVGDDGVVRNVEAEIRVDRDLPAAGRDLDVLRHGFS